MPAGSILVKDSFLAHPDGTLAVGPLFVMEKVANFDKRTGNWRYTMVMPDGSVFGVTNGQNAAGMEFCHTCHAIQAADQDYLFFLPEEFRAAAR